jgi:hypothetical protein
LASSERLVAALTPRWREIDAQTQARWDRDQPLLAVASKARALRLAAAWERLGTAPG